jgi:hypothetical protein
MLAANAVNNNEVKRNRIERINPPLLNIATHRAKVSRAQRKNYSINFEVSLELMDLRA